jgi:hypothetical protein
LERFLTASSPDWVVTHSQMRRPARRGILDALEALDIHKRAIPMNESARPASQPARIPSAAAWAARRALGTMIATAIGLAAYVVIGVLSWAAVRGLHGIGLCGALGAAAGAARSGPGSRLARVLGGGIGGAFAGYFTVASGEVFPPGSKQWALSGGGYGALFGLPVAALVGGLIGLIGAVPRSLGIGHSTTADK